MQTIDKFNSNYGTAIGLVGPAGSGKTVLGMRLFPRTYVLVGDLNFQSGKRYLEKLNLLSNIVGFDTIDIDEKGEKVKPLLRYDRFFRCINDATENKSIDCIFVDGATQITQWIMAKLVNAQSEEQIQIKGGKDSWPLWGTLGVTWRGLIAQMRTTGKKFVLAIHEQKNQDESDSIWKHELLIPGQTKDMLPNLLSDVWRTEVHEASGKHTWMVRTLPNIRMEYLKNTYGLPALLPQDELVKTLESTRLSTPLVVT